MPAAAPTETLQRVMCSAALEAGADQPLPSEFRIFKAGLNDSSKGEHIFDAQAAADVMAHYAREGVDMMIDLEHQWMSSSAESRADAADARGYFKLALRNGELWAVDVKWSPDGERRLRERTQRYISPLFYVHKETRRVVQLKNVALVSNPATYHTAPLVAASKLSAGIPLTVCQALLVCIALTGKPRAGKSRRPKTQ